MTDSRTAPGTLAGKLLPELAVLLSVLWLLLAPPQWPGLDAEAIALGAFADGAMLMASCTLIDLASRLRKPPPWWIAPLVVAGMFLFFPETWEMAKLAWSLGYWMLLPFAWSIVERVREIWTLPAASDLEKIRRRTLTFDRLYVALVLGMAWIVVTLVGAFGFGLEFFELFGYDALPYVLVLFYAVSAINAVRVHRPAFARRPRSLLPFIDQDQAQSLDPL